MSSVALLPPFERFALREFFGRWGLESFQGLVGPMLGVVLARKGAAARPKTRVMEGRREVN
jgi:hypothetical protein